MSEGRRAVLKTAWTVVHSRSREIIPAEASPSFPTSVSPGRGASTELTASAARSKPYPGGTAR